MTTLEKFKRHAPTVSRLSAGIQDTVLLLRLRWHGIEKWYSRVAIVLGLALLVSAIVLVSYAGYFIRTLAQDTSGNQSVQDFALAYLEIFQDGQLGTIGATALGLSVVSAIIAPLGGAVRTFIITPRETAAIPLSRWHRFSDSIVAQLSSVISILQLIALTAISSLIVLQGGREIALLFTWTVWIALIALSTAATWGAEYLHRTFGPGVRAIIVGVLVVIMGVALLFDPNHGKTLFGLGTKYSEIVSTASNATILSGIGIILVPALIAFLLFAGAAFFSSMALSKPEYLPVKITDDKVKEVKLRKTFKRPELELVKTLILAITRSPEGRKPIITVLIIGTGGAAIMGGANAVATGFILMIPLVVALAWGSNAFGVIGNGLSWLCSQPKMFVKLPWLLFWLQVTVTLSLLGIIWFPAILLGKVGISTLYSTLCAGVATTFIMSRSSMQKSIKRPHPMYFGMRNETLLPPLTTIGYTFRFSLWAGQYGVIVFNLNDPWYQLIAMFAAIIWSLLRMTYLQNLWLTEPDVQRKVLTTFAQA